MQKKRGKFRNGNDLQGDFAFNFLEKSANTLSLERTRSTLKHKET